MSFFNRIKLMRRIQSAVRKKRPAMQARSLIEILRDAQSSGDMRAALLCSRKLERYGVYISRGAKLGDQMRLPHPTSIVIGEGVVIGSNVTIYQGVTLGGRVVGDWKEGHYPCIGNNCVIFAGAVVAGNVRIGDNSVVGANSVVLTDIPAGVVAVGAPARVVKELCMLKNIDER